MILARGELAGTWRQRTHGDRLELTTAAFGGALDLGAVEAEAGRLAEAMGRGGVTVHSSHS